MLAYSAEVFDALVAQYNATIWPVQPIAWALGILVLFLLFRPSRRATVIIGLVLGLLWCWTGIAFHWFVFSPYYFMAPVFAALFVLQAVLIAWVIWRNEDLRFAFSAIRDSWPAGVQFFLAMIFFPLLPPLTGQGWAQAAHFGVSSPTLVLFSLGLFLLGKPRNWLLVIVPLLWCAYSAYVALALPSNTDTLLVIAGLFTLNVAIATRGKAG